MKPKPISAPRAPRARRQDTSNGDPLPERDEVLRLLRSRNHRRESLRRVDVRRDEPRLVSAAEKHFGSWPDAVTEAGFVIRRYQRWDDQRVIDEILRMHREGESLRQAHVPPSLFWAARGRFGGWPAAIKRAGLDYDEVCVGANIHARESTLPDRDELLRLVRSRDRRKKSLRRVDVVKDEPRLVSAAMKHFGSWPNAVAEAGFRPRRNQRWNDERVIDEILRLHGEGASLRQTHVPSPLYWAAREHFGGWPEAIKRAGLDYDEVCPGPTSPSTQATLVRILREAATSDRVGIGPDGFVTSTVADQVRKSFGSFAEGMKAAGLDPNLIKRSKRRPDDELLAEMRALAREQPEMHMAAFHKVGLARAIKRSFGTIEAAAAAAGLPGWPRRLNFSLPSPNELLVALQARHRRGEPMRVTDVMQTELRLAKAARKHFGSWRSALRAAGLGDLVWYEDEWGQAQVTAELRARRQRGEALDAKSIQRDDAKLWSGLQSCFGDVTQALRAANLLRPSSDPRPRLDGPADQSESTRRPLRKPASRTSRASRSS